MSFFKTCQQFSSSSALGFYFKINSMSIVYGVCKFIIKRNRVSKMSITLLITVKM